MNVAFMGSVSSSRAALEALLRSGIDVKCVLGLNESHAERVSDFHSLRDVSERGGVPFHSFARVADPGVAEFLRAHSADMLWVIGLSQMVPEGLIETAREGAVGFHPTMLPEGRGRAPVAWTILSGARAAVSLFYLTDQPDAGALIAQREVPVGPDDYSEDLIRRTNEVLADVIAELAPAIRSGRLAGRPQDDRRATYYPKRTPADGRIDWSKSTDEVYRLVRAAGRPYAGAFCYLGESKVVVWRGRPATADEALGDASPGQVIQVQAEKGTLVRTGDGGFWMTDLQCDDDGTPAMMVGRRLSANEVARTGPG